MHRSLLSYFDSISLRVYNIGIHFVYKIHLWPFVKADFLLINMGENRNGLTMFVEVFRIEFQHS